MNKLNKLVLIGRSLKYDGEEKELFINLNNVYNELIKNSYNVELGIYFGEKQAKGLDIIEVIHSLEEGYTFLDFYYSLDEINFFLKRDNFLKVERAYLFAKKDQELLFNIELTLPNSYIWARFKEDTLNLEDEVRELVKDKL